MWCFPEMCLQNLKPQPHQLNFLGYYFIYTSIPSIYIFYIHILYTYSIYIFIHILNTYSIYIFIHILNTYFYIFYTHILFTYWHILYIYIYIIYYIYIYNHVWIYIITWFTWFSPNVFQEVDRVSFGKSLTYDQLSQLSYTEAVLREALRLYPSVPLDSKFVTEAMTPLGPLTSCCFFFGMWLELQVFFFPFFRGARVKL